MLGFIEHKQHRVGQPMTLHRTLDSLLSEVAA